MKKTLIALALTAGATFTVMAQDIVDTYLLDPADADIITAHGLFHIGGGLGLHQIIELQAGSTNYRNFQSSDGATLAPRDDTDFSFAAGYGIGFGFSLPLAGAMSLLEVIVVGVQAYVFTLLTATFIGMAIHAHH